MGVGFFLGVFGLAELFFLIKIGSALGPLTTVLWCVSSAIIGIQIARIQGFKVFIESSRDMMQGQMPAKGVLEACLIILAGILLMAPGFMGDALGMLLLIPPLRSWMLGRSLDKFGARFEPSQRNYTYHDTGSRGYYRVEVLESRSDRKDVIDV